MKPELAMSRSPKNLELDFTGEIKEGERQLPETGRERRIFDLETDAKRLRTEIAEHERQLESVSDNSQTRIEEAIKTKNRQVAAMERKLKQLKAEVKNFQE